jgi:protein ImuB
MKGEARLNGPQGFAIMAMTENAWRLAAVDERAAALGAAPGQAMTDALALSPLMSLFEAEPEADGAALARVARWCMRFTPAVALDAPDGVMLDIDGCAHLWGGELGLAHALHDRLRAQEMPARVAVADTFGAAWALARFGAEEIVICDTIPSPWGGGRGRGRAEQDAADSVCTTFCTPPLPTLPPMGGGCIKAALAPLPVAALRLEENVAAQLRRLGLKTIGDVAALPRPALRKRFGAGLLLQLGRAFGAEEEALAYLHPPTPWSERAVFAEPIARPEAVQLCVRELAEALCARLAHEGLGARRFTAEFHRVDGEAARRVVSAALPARDAKRLMDLFTPKLESVDPGFGIEVALLRAARVEPLRAAQTDLVANSATAQNADLAPLIDRLRNRLGEARVWRAASYPSHVPERAVTQIAPLAPPVETRWARGAPRPLRLFARPQPIEAVAPVPDDPPLLFRWRGKSHRVRAAEGPERIGAEWWRKPWDENEIDRVRDYYRVENEAGARFWLFRTGLYGGARATRWFLHGLFA